MEPTLSTNICIGLEMLASKTNYSTLFMRKNNILTMCGMEKNMKLHRIYKHTLLQPMVLYNEPIIVTITAVHTQATPS